MYLLITLISHCTTFETYNSTHFLKNMLKRELTIIMLFSEKNKPCATHLFMLS